MFDEPDEKSSESASAPEQRAKEKSDELRMHAELAAVFEGIRKFGAALDTHFSPETARHIQRTIGKLEKAKLADMPVIDEDGIEDALKLLRLPISDKISTNDYHVYRRPGELMIARFLEGDEVANFYQRLQAHFDAGLEGFIEDERSSHEWKQDDKAQAFLDAMRKIKLKMDDRYLRSVIKEHNLLILSTQLADEMNIVHLSEYIMGIPPTELVGSASTPPANPTDNDLAWFFKLFSLRGYVEKVERMCFFAYLQKTGEY